MDNWLILASVFFAGIVAVGVLVVYNLKKGGTPPKVDAEKPKEAGTASTASSERKFRLTWWQVAGLALLGLLVYFYGKTLAEKVGSLNAGWQIGLVLVVLIAVGKGWVRNFALGVVAAITVIYLGWFTFTQHEYGKYADKVVSTQQEQRAAKALAEVDDAKRASNEGAATGYLVQVKALEWPTRNDDGTIPTGTWSEPADLPVRCNITFDGGQGEVFAGQYQWFSPKWHDMVMGKHYTMNKFRLKMLRPGHKELTYKLECSPRPY